MLKLFCGKNVLEDAPASTAEIHSFLLVASKFLFQMMQMYRRQIERNEGV